jgi:hypothetical protein
VETFDVKAVQVSNFTIDPDVAALRCHIQARNWRAMWYQSAPPLDVTTSKGAVNWAPKLHRNGLEIIKDRAPLDSSHDNILTPSNDPVTSWNQTLLYRGNRVCPAGALTIRLHNSHTMYAHQWRGSSRLCFVLSSKW